MTPSSPRVPECYLSSCPFQTELSPSLRLRGHQQAPCVAMSCHWHLPPCHAQPRMPDSWDISSSLSSNSHSPTLSARCALCPCARQPDTKKSLNKGILMSECLRVLGGRPVFPCHVLLRDTSGLRESEGLFMCVTTSCGWAVLTVHATLIHTCSVSCCACRAECFFVSFSVSHSFI